MDHLIQTILTWAQNQGIGVAMLLFALWWTTKTAKKEAEDKATVIAAAWVATDKERLERWKANDAILASLTARTELCEADRQRLSSQLFQLAMREGTDITQESKI